MQHSAFFYRFAFCLIVGFLSFSLNFFSGVAPLAAAPLLDDLFKLVEPAQKSDSLQHKQSLQHKKRQLAKPKQNTPPSSQYVVAQVRKSEKSRRDDKTKRANKKSLYSQEVFRRNQHVVTLLSGDLSGTNARLAADIANVLDFGDGRTPIRVVPILGRGGVQNLKDLLFLKGVDMAIVSQAQLSFIERQDPDLFRDISKNIQYISKIYNAEFQILANKSIGSILDLDGKRVVLGKKLGSTDMDARYVFKQLGVNIIPVYTDFMHGIDELENNGVDAIVTLGGAPVRGFRTLRNPSDYHFLPITPQTIGLELYFNITDKYLPIKITAKQYPNLIEKNKPVSTISTSVVLAIYRWKKTHKRYEKLSRFVQAFFENLYHFDQRSRHPKWEEINIDAKVAGWSQFGAATEWLKSRRKLIGKEVSAGEMKIAMDAFVRQYSKVGNSEQVSPLLRDDIWASMTRVFGRWWVVVQ